MQREVTIEYFAEHPLELLEEVAETQIEIVVTRDGKPYVMIVPLVGRWALTPEELQSISGNVDSIDGT